MAVDERVNVCYMVYNGSYFRFPLPEDANNTWFSDSQENVGFQGDDSLFVYSILPIIIRVFFKDKKTETMSCRQHFGGN